jgi:histone chaperone ASF1
MVEDHEMAGVEAGAAVPEDEESDNGSEDLEGESSGSDEEDIEEEEEVEGEGDDSMEVDGADKASGGAGSKIQHQEQPDEVMVH